MPGLSLPRLRGWGPLLGMSVLTLAVAVPPLSLATSSKEDDIARLNSAAVVFREVMGTPEKRIPEEILQGAQCIAIIPGEKKAAIGLGGNFGKGVALCRNGVGTAWGPPLFVTIGGGSTGFQLGIQSSDVIMVFGNRSQLNSLLSSKFRIGAEASAAAGPVGRHVLAGTDIKLNSTILVYGRSKGLFAGVSISGAVVQPDDTGNAAMYGSDLSSQAILSGRGAKIPAAAEPLIRELTRNPSTAPPHKRPR